MGEGGALVCLFFRAQYLLDPRGVEAVGRGGRAADVAPVGHAVDEHARAAEAGPAQLALSVAVRPLLAAAVAVQVAVWVLVAEAVGCWRLVAKGQLATGWLGPCSGLQLSECRRAADSGGEC
jgi:hypothetical protein